MPAHPSAPMALRPDAHQAFWRDPSLPFVESRRACHSRACYKPHRHPTYSIGAVDGGSSLFTGAVGGPLALRPGTLVFVPEERVHACNPAPDTAWSYQMLHLDARWLRGVREEYAQAGATTEEAIGIVTAPLPYAHFCRLNALLFSDAEPGDKEAALIEFIGKHDAAQSLRIDTPGVAARLREQLRPALDYLRAAPAASITLHELAGLARMSRYQLIRAFRSATGMTPHAWQLNERINLARERLRKGDDLAGVAQRLGFADQAHFQRVFKAYVGIPPGRFRA